MNKIKLLNNLKDNSIEHILTEHPPVYSVEDSKTIGIKIRGTKSKNLFLKNKKNFFFLFSCIDTTNINLKKVSKSINIGNISFANENHLVNILGVSPGSVSPFGLLNDEFNQVQFFLDKKILNEKNINFHPLENTSTITISVKKFIDFMINNNKLIHVYDFENYSIIKELK